MSHDCPFIMHVGKVFSKTLSVCSGWLLECIEEVEQAHDAELMSMNSICTLLFFLCVEYRQPSMDLLGY